MTTLEEVRAALVAKLGDEGRLVLLNARIILRTGVNLVTLDPKHVHDHTRIAKVLGALREMGFELS